MAPPVEVVRLVERFEEQREDYRRGRYNEAQLREDFLNPLFKALGWDVHNERGWSEAYREVIHEAAIKVGGRTKAPDYCFRAGGGKASFFVEAKKPSVDIREAVSPAYQLRRYAWSAKLPVSILTDFEEFAVYDCRVRPVKNDKASTGRVIYHTYTEYAECWDELAGLFSPEAIRRGALERFVASKRVKKGTAEVDAAFLSEIEAWREVLARNIALRNKGLSRRELNFAVQRTVDRIIFLRICEDRGIERYGTLQAVQNGPKVYRRLAQLFQQADDRYNSGLFYFTGEKGRGAPDELTLGLTVDDKPLKEILKNLYYPDSPYEFSVLPAEILGQVYEQFLGKVIRLTKRHQAKVEEKPEVKKAGGVYYTPKYIVDYIVEHTVGKLLKGGRRKGEGGNGKAEGGRRKAEGGKRMTPRGAAKLRILDPACGSGSFLIGAYQYLLDWHRDWYVEDDPQKHARGRSPKLYRSAAGDWRLTTAEKKRILLGNIYGVDIDAQAVEVTKLSLLLKVLEGESQETISNQLRLFHERALPDLASNIKCGNSLIGPDFYDDKQMSLLDEEERYRINVFDWQAEFPEVFRGENPGFDAVIGNPPYISMLQLDKSQHPAIKPYWKRTYDSAAGAFDIYVLFVEQGIALVRKDGFVSFIIPNKFLAAEYAKEFRRWLLTATRFLSLLDFSRAKVWTAAVYPVVPVLQKDRYQCNFQIHVRVASEPSIEKLRELPSVPSNLLRKVPDNIWSFLTQPGADILFKVLEKADALETVAQVCGACTVAEGSEYPRIIVQESQANLSDETGKFVVSGSIFRYATNWRSQQVQFMHENYSRPLIRLTTPMPQRRVEQARSRKILISKVALEPRAFLDEEGEYVGAYTTYVFSEQLSLHFLTGILNSRLVKFAFRCLYDALAMSGGYLRFQPPQVRRIPVCHIDRARRQESLRHDRMVELVERMLSLHKQLASAKGGHDKTVIQRQIEATDRQIDRLVYELYGLTEEEIAIVEEATGKKD